MCENGPPEKNKKKSENVCMAELSEAKYLQEHYLLF